MIKHTITITYEEYENTSEDFEIFRGRFFKFLKDNPLILKESEEYIENKLRDEFGLVDQLYFCLEDEEMVLKEHVKDVIYYNIEECQYNSIRNLFSDAYKEMLKKARQLLCPAPTNSNE